MKGRVRVMEEDVRRCRVGFVCVGGGGFDEVRCGMSVCEGERAS
jgi:hypothetical protein